jgi:transcriptional regulator with XRE-family HTH domain
MDLSHPIDQAVRSKLRELAPNQVALASAIGRSQGWLNKYMQGDGTATIDDLVRIACAFIGVNVQPLSELERRLLKAFRGIPEDRRDDAVAVFEPIAKSYRLGRPQGSTAPAVHTPPATSRKARGRR